MGSCGFRVEWGLPPLLIMVGGEPVRDRSLCLNSCADRSRGDDCVGVAVHDPPGISLASENHGDPQGGRTYSLATCQPRLATLNLDDVAKVRSAVSRYLFETTYGTVAELGGSVCCRLVDFSRSTAGEGQANWRA